jgi:uncharacterized protein
MSTNTDALKRGYEAFNRGDVDGVMEIFSDNIEWEGPNAEGVPMSGTYRGKEEVARGFAQIAESWDPFRVSPDEMVEQGDTVVVLSHIEGSARTTGQDVKIPGVEVWRMSDGVAHRAQTLVDTAVIRDALAG